MSDEKKVNGKPFWKSKAFWGGVIAIAAPVAAPLMPPAVGGVIGSLGGLLAIMGRASASAPLTLSARVETEKAGDEKEDEK